MKNCPKCDIQKELTYFSKDKNRPGGISSWCRTCCGIAQRGRYKANPKKHLEDNRKWRKDNPLNKLATDLRKYKLTIEQFNDIRKQQNYCCAVCKINERDLGRRFHVDHCHVTKQVRALLCSNCNTAFGLLKENIFIIHALGRYCIKHSTDLADNTKEKVG